MGSSHKWLHKINGNVPKKGKKKMMKVKYYDLRVERKFVITDVTRFEIRSFPWHGKTRDWFEFYRRGYNVCSIPKTAIQILEVSLCEEGEESSLK